MSRKGVKKRSILADPRFHNQVVAKFINRVMICGKKSVAEAIEYKALDALSEKVGVTQLESFEKALGNVKPMIEVRSRRVGGATYQIPMEVRTERGNALAMRWLINAARTRHGRTMDEKLLSEFLDAYNMKGSAVKKKEDTHKMAESNRAFAHYRW